MRMSQLTGRRYKERPAEATLESHAFLLRGGYARQVAAGIYSLLHPGLRIVRKIERIIREEMDRIDGQEVLMSLVQPRELWEESGRYQAIGPEMARFQDRGGHDMVLAMTHEEGVVHLVRGEISSYKQLPAMIYQIQTKFRDEPRARGGLIRVREFTMKDAYSFHTSNEDLEKYYRICYRAYQRIFARAGLPEVVAVQSDTGMMGGKVAHEFILLCDVGEDTIVSCDSCTYLANQEVAIGKIQSYPEEIKVLEKVYTPGMKTIEDVAKFLGVATRQTAKAVFYETDENGLPVLAIIRGDIEISEIKLAKIIRMQPKMATDARVAQTGAVAGFASPIGLDAAKVRIIIDQSLANSNNLVCGANEIDYHYKNFNLERDVPGAELVDIAQVRGGDGCPVCGGKLVLKNGIEVGNIFQLGTKYSSAMGMRYLDENGDEQVPIMGCYGIGVGRLLSSTMEVRRDKFGPIWPISISPWQVQLNALKIEDESVKRTAEALYDELQSLGIEVLYDDRGERPGVQFAEADLLGIPFRLIVSERNLANGQIEWKRRDTGESGLVAIAEAAQMAQNWVADALAQIENVANQID